MTDKFNMKRGKATDSRTDYAEIARSNMADMNVGAYNRGQISKEQLETRTAAYGGPQYSYSGKARISKK